MDLTMMPETPTDGPQDYGPTGIHWQVSQSTSLQNIFFNMPQGGGTTAVGIFMENGKKSISMFSRGEFLDPDRSASFHDAAIVQ
jgi:hypothetical protein